MNDANIIIDNKFVVGDEHHVFFDCEAHELLHFQEGTTIIDILVHFGIFPSKSQARKNWKNAKIEIAAGWTDFTDDEFQPHISRDGARSQRGFGKKKLKIFILNPTKENIEEIKNDS